MRRKCCIFAAGFIITEILLGLIAYAQNELQTAGSEIQELRQKLGLTDAQVEQVVSIIAGEIEKRKAIIEGAARSGGVSSEQLQQEFTELRQETENLLSGCLSREQLSEWKKNVQDETVKELIPRSRPAEEAAVK